ncbi:MAG: 1,4-alpha-glucan branching protein GlgB [Clostridiales bacterium]|jgi:1,4-alpha-glucan branching enzyme|nr:1,4-alpha-glucan branching protein GlgB [Clostridiales bacterium]
MTDEKSAKERFFRGELTEGYKYFGCQYDSALRSADFRVWAPGAKSVALIGDFNGWNRYADYMHNDGGIWRARKDDINEYDRYKFFITTFDGRELYKSDPYAFHGETRGGTDSKVFDVSKFAWTDGKWRELNGSRPPYDKPVNIYEAHIGSWRRYPDGNYFDYRKFADEAAPYLKDMNYTHIELMGIAEHPFDGSWGYQVTGYFAPTSRHGTPADFAYMVNVFHNAGIGVILDWVPGHFPKDANGLYEFDGGPLYEPSDPLKKEHTEWGTRCFDYGRGEVKSFLISNAMYWFDVYHIDGLRVDAVASMLYLDYGRRQWRPNMYGGKENLEAIDFLRALNTAVFAARPGAMMIAEESTAWPLVTRPVTAGGLGFNFKWNMGWMNDTLAYAGSDPLFRLWKHNNMTFSMTYAFTENYILPISHDEVVHGKRSLLDKMPGDYGEKFAGLRLYLMSMFSHPGKKLAFMGTEFAQMIEWDYSKELDWLLLAYPSHAGTRDFVRALNGVYASTPALYQIEDDWSGFEWLVPDDAAQNVLVYERRDRDGNRLLCVYNFSPVERKDYRFGVGDGVFSTVLKTDLNGWSVPDEKFATEDVPSHAKKTSLRMDIPPYCGVYMLCAARGSAAKTPRRAAKNR